MTEQHRPDPQSRSPAPPNEQSRDARDARATNDDSRTSEAGRGPSTDGTLSAGYSSRSSNGGTAGDVLRDRGSGYSPGADSRAGARPSETDELASEGVTAGAAGATRRSSSELPPGAGGDAEQDEGVDGAASITGVSGTSGGSSGTGASSTRK